MSAIHSSLTSPEPLEAIKALFHHPNFKQAHPTPEHFFPLVDAVGGNRVIALRSYMLGSTIVWDGVCIGGSAICIILTRTLCTDAHPETPNYLPLDLHLTSHILASLIIPISPPCHISLVNLRSSQRSDCQNCWSERPCDAFLLLPLHLLRCRSMPSLIRIIFLPTRVTILVTYRTFIVLYHFFIRPPFHVMSAILEALLNNHEGTDTARPSRADHLGSEVHGEVDLIDLKDPENPRIRNDTPFPSSKMSISSRSENSSFRAHLPIPESPLPKKRGEAGESTSSSPPDDPTTLNSPVRNEQTVDADQTPASAGFSSTYSTPTELLFGPQSLPFVLRRHATTNTADTSPTKQPKTPYLHRPRNTSIPAVIVLSGDDDEDEQNDPDREIEQIVHSMRTPLINGARIPHNAANMSSWRTEQIKYTKRARRGPDSGLKAVPHLHGPLSLPYARNPRYVTSSHINLMVADTS